MEKKRFKHDRICPTKRAPIREAKMFPGSRLGLCESCGALLPMAVYGTLPKDVLDLVFTLANRENDDPLVCDARFIVEKIEMENPHA